MIQYLLEQGFDDAADAVSKATAVTAEESKKEGGMLEKKWTSVIRLQKKIMELEQNITQLKEELETANAGGRKKRGDASLALPRVPHKHELKGHRSTVTSIAVHPIYTQVVSCSEDATIKVWDYESGEFEKSLKGHTDFVQCVAFNHTGTMIASCSSDLTIKLWETESFNCVKTLKGHEHNVSCVAFLPPASGKDHLISSSRDKSIKLWDCNTGYCVKTLTGHSEWVRRVVVCEDGVTAASCSNDHSVRIWRLDSGAQVSVFSGHSHVVEDIAFNLKPEPPKEGSSSKPKPFTLMLASASRDKSVKVCRKKYCLLVSSAFFFSLVKFRAFLNGGVYITHFLNIRHSFFSPIELSRRQISDALYFGELAISNFFSYISSLCQVWDVAREQILFNFQGHDNWVRGVVFHPNGRFVLSVSDDKAIIIWDMEQNRYEREKMKRFCRFCKLGLYFL
tara:strand:+ start:558 stop:1910 length:1353 start_codon:yes stop_codon:yes gene_type:complete